MIAVGEKNKIYHELVNALGADHVSDDPAVREAYTREGQTPAFMTQGKPEFIVLPGSTEDVQRILRLANRYKFPWSVAATGFLFRYTGAVKPYWCFIDLKRMNRWEIDEKNGYAVVEPYVSVSQLSAEAMKLGWWLPHPRDGAHFSVLANSCVGGSHVTAYRTGRARHHSLGAELVLPSGEVLRTGSLAIPGGGYCWGEGPGPDLSAIGTRSGHVGALGVITRIGIRLFPWPGPPVLPTEGVNFERQLKLPTERFKCFLFTYPTMKAAIEAMRHIGKAEIGVIVEHWPFNCLNRRVARSNEEFWSKWRDRYWQRQIKNNVLVHLWDFTSEKQLEYEERVLKQIIEDTGGQLVPDEVYKDAIGALFRNPYPSRMLRFGSYAGAGAAMDSIDDVLPSLDMGRTLEKHYPPLLDYESGDGVINPHNLSRFFLCVPSGSYEKTDENELEIHEMMLETPAGSATADPIDPAKITKTVLTAARIKQALDPNNVANPTRFIDMETMTMPPVST